MRKKHIMLMLSLAVSYLGFGQLGQIPNVDFDDWSSRTHYEYLDGYSSSNNLGYNIVNCTKSTDAQSGNYSLKLETFNTTFPQIAYALLGKVDGSGQFVGGLPFTTVINGISGYYKCDIPPSDSAMILVVLKNSGVAVSQDLVYIKGTQNSWTQFNFPINGGGAVPDTIIWGVVSSDSFNSNPVVGEWIMLDNVTFTAAGVVGPVPNLSFETWADFNTNEVDGWNSTNPFSDPNFVNLGELPCGKRQPGVGSVGSAVILQTVVSTEGDLITGVLCNGEIEMDDYDLVYHGINYFGSPTKLSGYYYKPSAVDTGRVTVSLYESGALLFENTQKFYGATTSFTYFEVPLTYSGAPDSLKIFFYSGDNLGTQLHLDSISLSGGNLSVDNFIEKESISLYPIPVENELYIEFEKGIEEIYIYDLTGKLMEYLVVKANTGFYEVDFSNYDSGLYLINLRGKNLNFSKKVVKK